MILPQQLYNLIATTSKKIRSLLVKLSTDATLNSNPRAIQHLMVLSINNLGSNLVETLDNLQELVLPPNMGLALKKK